MIVIDNPHFIDGWQAYSSGIPVDANPFLFLANPHRLWHSGWHVAQLIDLAEQGIFELPGDQIDSEAGLMRLDKSPFVQGQVAYRKRITIDDCPYAPDSQDCADWRAGWEWECNHGHDCRTFTFDEIDLMDRKKPRPTERLAWLAALARWYNPRRGWLIAGIVIGGAVTAFLVA